MVEEIDKRETMDKLRADWPEAIRCAIGLPLWSKQVEIIHSVQHHKRTAVVACSSAGKTFDVAALACIFLPIFTDSIVMTTAPTMVQVKNQIWREIRRIHRESKTSLGGKPLTTQWEISPSWYAIGISPKDPDAMKGFHSSSGHILVIVDEARGVPQVIFDAIETLMTQEHAKLILIGNGGPATGEFGKAFTERRSDYNRIYISAYDTPNLKAGRTVAPYLITNEYVEEKKRKWGVGTPLWNARILGQITSSDPDDLIPLELLDAVTDCEKSDDIADIRLVDIGKTETEIKLAQEQLTAPIGIGTDVAREGDDQTVIAVIKGTKLIELRITKHENAMQTVGRCTAALEDYPGAAHCIDRGDAGSGVIDRMQELNLEAIEIKFGANARDKESYFPKRAELYCNARDFLLEARKNGQQVFDSTMPGVDDVIGQLAAVKYKLDSKNRHILEPKDKIKKTVGRSPDEADAFVLAVEALICGRLSSGDISDHEGFVDPEPDFLPSERRRIGGRDNMRTWT